MAIHGKKPKIRHKNMVDGVAANGGQIYILTKQYIKNKYK